MLEILPLAVTLPPAPGAAPFTGSFDVFRLVLECGIAAAALWCLFGLHKDIVKSVIPAGFALIQAEMQTQLKAAEKRHAEHIKEMKITREALKAVKLAIVQSRLPRRRGVGKRSPKAGVTYPATKGRTKSRRK